ncbi:SNARE associated Golgi protein-like protein [Bacillus methanolicus PB1]|uniref:SNARE associated Golgi protein-like protein n=1 Tax=Bacillus methanolicus PB1 TaxID=997296 RepID=I3DVV2_BACMT|nr:SNARE associated Golgi protein-like protein [Bacillus methanolicus PB1]
MDSFLLIIMLPILPFMPSGIVNLAAALSKTNLLIFSAASTLGKLPALMIEAYSVKQIIEWDFGGKILLLVFSFSLFIILLKRKKRKRVC